MAHGDPYTAADDAELRKLAAAGLRPRQIAEKMGRTWNSVRLRCWKIGIGFCPQRGPHEPALIDTPRGKMTRRQAAQEFGVPFGTLCRRIWEGCAPEFLFERGRAPRGALSRPASPYVGDRRRHYDRGHGNFVEKWEDRKARRASERAIVDPSC